MADPTERLLRLLHGVRKTGPESYVARCPAHDDRRASLSVRRGDDGRVLVHCFSGGCSASSIVGSVGLDVRDLFPPREDDDGARPGRRRRAAPIPARDALQVLDQEAMVLEIGARALLEGKVTPEVVRRIEEASGRIGAVRASWMESA